ncbi:hypothetical protein Tco_1421513, partial [Tanacetum coccineum]
VEEKTEDDIDLVAPTNTVTRLILEWEERIMYHQEKEMGFNQWRSAVFDDKCFIFGNEGSEVIFDEEKPESSLEFHVGDSWMTI